MVKYSITHVLLVDERIESRRSLAEICRAASLPIDVIEADSLAEASLVIARRRVDLVLLNVTLPEGSGVPLLQRSQAILRDTPIIAVGEDESEAPRYIAVGAQDYLQKSTLTEQLLSRAVRYAIERHALVTELRRLSLTDDLTGLYNRRGFFLLGRQVLEGARRSGRSALVLYVDVDGLKRINDQYGHSAGDRLLVDAAGVIRSTFREVDVTARIGGDEFAVLAEADDPKELIARIQRAADRHNQARPHAPSLSLSLGAEVDPPVDRSTSNLTLSDLLSAADSRMYATRAARRSGLAEPDTKPVGTRPNP